MLNPPRETQKRLLSEEFFAVFVLCPFFCFPPGQSEVMRAALISVSVAVLFAFGGP